MRNRTMLAVWLISLAICGIAPMGIAAEDSAEQPGRSVTPESLIMRRCFDFEKGRLISEVREVPVHWQKIVSDNSSPSYDRGHPAYNEGWLVSEGRRIDVGGAAEAFWGHVPKLMEEPNLENLHRSLLVARAKLIAPKNRYLRLKLYKGKVSYQTRDFIPISRLNSYRIDAKIRTHDFKGIREPVKAWMSVLWYRKDAEGGICLHADGSPVIFRTMPIETETGEEWRQMRLLFNRTPFDANFVKIRLTVEGVSTTAEADFDDVVLTQEPQVLLGFKRMPAVFFGDEQGVLNVELGGLPDGDYSEKIEIDDVSLGEGTEVLRSETAFRIAGGTTSVTNRSINVDTGRFGVFRMRYSLVMKNVGSILPVASREIVFARAVGPVPFIERGRYGTTLDFFATPYPCAFDFALLTATSPFKTTLWPHDDGDEVLHAKLVASLKLLRRSSITTAGVLKPLGTTRAAALGISTTGSLFAMFRQPSANAEKAWFQFIKTSAPPWADNISHLQMGEDFDTSIADTGLYETVEKKLRDVLPRPLDSARMILPVRSLNDKPLPSGEYLTHFVPAAVTPEGLARRLETMRDIADRLWVTLEVPVIYDVGASSAQLAEMVRKIVLCRVYNVRSVIIPLLGSVAKRDGLLSYKALPDETLDINPLAVAMLNVASVLERAEFEDAFVSEDANVIIFRKQERFIAMLFSQMPGVTSRMYWGGGLVAYDAMGNSRKLTVENNMALIDGIGPMPIFVDNIDVGVARTWHSIRLETPDIVSRVAAQTVTMSLKNHFDRPISGMMKIKFPEELQHLVVRYEPKPFELAPGEVWNSGKQLQLSPSVADGIGGKEFEVNVEIRVDGASHVLKKTLVVKLVSDKLSLENDGVTVNEDGYVVLHLKVRNGNERRISSNMYIKVENSTVDRKVSILGLESGATRLVEVRLPFKPADVPGRIWIGLREIGGRQFANLYIVPAELKDGEGG